MDFHPDNLAKYPSLRKFENREYKEWKSGRETKLLQFIWSHPNLDKLRDNPSELLNAIDEFACNKDFLINIGPHKSKIIAGLISTQKPRVLVELGTYVGYSAILMADSMRRASPDSVKGLRIWSLESDPLFAAIAMSLIELAGLSEIVVIVTGEASKSLVRLHRDKKLDHVDFLFLDHVENLYTSDLKVCESLNLLSSSAMIVADNIILPGAPEYRDYVRRSPRYESVGVPALIVPGDMQDELEVSRVN